MRPLRALVAVLSCALAAPAWCETRAELTQQVRDAENAFAGTMAARDLDAFASFLADDAIFFGHTVARGKPAVVAACEVCACTERPQPSDSADRVQNAQVPEPHAAVRPEV